MGDRGDPRLLPQTRADGGPLPRWGRVFRTHNQQTCAGRRRAGERALPGDKVEGRGALYTPEPLRHPARAAL